jgi:hypothetical protein
VNGQALSPTEPVTATAYAIVSNSVMDNAISPAKVAPGFGLVPSGAIVMFASGCPPGWQVFTGLQGKYPVGADGSADFTVGVSTGNLTHNHGGVTGDADRGTYQLVGTPAGATAGMYLEDVANQSLERASHHAHGIAAGSSLPPSLPVVFCVKQ